jgi:hypothetical protein
MQVIELRVDVTAAAELGGQCAVTMMLPGAFAAYSASRDVTIFVIPAMAHMHNFASTRERLWQRLEAWSRTLAVAKFQLR